MCNVAFASKRIETWVGSTCLARLPYRRSSNNSWNESSKYYIFKRREKDRWMLSLCSDGQHKYTNNKKEGKERLKVSTCFVAATSCALERERDSREREGRISGRRVAPHRYSVRGTPIAHPAHSRRTPTAALWFMDSNTLSSHTRLAAGSLIVFFISLA